MHLFSSHGPAQNLPVSSAPAPDMACRVKANDHQGLAGPTTCFMPLDSSLAPPPPCCIHAVLLAGSASGSLHLLFPLLRTPFLWITALLAPLIPGETCANITFSVVSPELPPYPHFLFYYLKIFFGHAIFILLLLLNFFWLFCVAGGILVPLPGIEPMSPVAEVES